MKQKEIIACFVKLGHFFDQVLAEKPTSSSAVTLSNAIKKEHIYNGWFTESSVREALMGIRSWLYEDVLTRWANQYVYAVKPKRVGLVMAGNIPMVGFHDLLSVLISGNKAMIKPSSSDSRILPLILNELIAINDDLRERIQIVMQLKGFDAVIATGSDNSSKYFESYFATVPNLIRKNRTSVAVITGDETSDDFVKLGKDIFTFFGLGCRNVSQLLIPESFDLNRFFGPIVKYGDVINHHKYANNYDYYRTIYLMNREPILENGFLLLKESNELHSPLAVLYYHRYASNEEVNNYLIDNRHKIQATVGLNFIPFGDAQSPKVDDYADGVDTMKFLSDLN